MPRAAFKRKASSDVAQAENAIVLDDRTTLSHAHAERRAVRDAYTVMVIPNESRIQRFLVKLRRLLQTSRSGPLRSG